MGTTEGPPVAYHLPSTNLIPLLLPWLAILALLALKPNRGWFAWWIWVPLFCLAAGWHWLQPGWQGTRSSLPNDVVDALFDVPRALAFGVAALWLLAPYVGRRQRLSTPLGMFLVLAAFGVFSCAVTAGLGNGAVVPDVSAINNQFAIAAGLDEGSAQIVSLVLLAVVIAAAMGLSGLACRGRYLPFRLCLWLFGALLAVVFAAGGLLYVLGLMTSGGRIEWSLFFISVLVVAAVIFATLLPFLILSSASPFFRERLKALLHMKSEYGESRLRIRVADAPGRTTSIGSQLDRRTEQSHSSTSAGQ